METNLPSVELKEMPGKGLCVFAQKDFAKGEIIEICPVIPLTKKETNILQKTVFDHYMYPYISNRTYCLVLGYGSLYNHSFYANADWNPDPKHKSFVYKAHQDIKKGEEILVNYNGHPTDPTPIKWFDVL